MIYICHLLGSYRNILLESDCKIKIYLFQENVFILIFDVKIIKFLFFIKWTTKDCKLDAYATLLKMFFEIFISFWTIGNQITTETFSHIIRTGKT